MIYTCMHLQSVRAQHATDFSRPHISPGSPCCIHHNNQRQAVMKNASTTMTKSGTAWAEWWTVWVGLWGGLSVWFGHCGHSIALELWRYSTDSNIGSEQWSWVQSADSIPGSQNNCLPHHHITNTKYQPTEPPVYPSCPAPRSFMSPGLSLGLHNVV